MALTKARIAGLASPRNGSTLLDKGGRREPKNNAPCKVAWQFGYEAKDAHSKSTAYEDSHLQYQQRQPPFAETPALAEAGGARCGLPSGAEGSRSRLSNGCNRKGRLSRDLARAEDLCKVEMKAGSKSPLHYHKVMTEAYLIVGGVGSMTVGETTRKVGPGDCVSIPPGAVHRERWIEHSKLHRGNGPSLPWGARYSRYLGGCNMSAA